MLRRLQMVLMLLLIAPAIPARAQEPPENQKPVKAAPAAPANGAVTKPATDDPNYIIGAQDVLDISVWKEPEVSRIVPVRPDGKISLPLLNDVQAAGLSPGQLATQITESLKKYVANPQVTVIVTTMNSQRIYILGEVGRPGAYPLLPGMTILQALSSGGGFTQYANTKKIYLLRQVSGKQEKYLFNYKDAVAGRHAEQNVSLKAGDTIVVP